MTNMKIRLTLMETGVRQYELGKLLGVSESTIWRKMRFEMPEEEQEKIVRLIKESVNNG